jgi:hypothetical protein
MLAKRKVIARWQALLETYLHVDERHEASNYGIHASAILANNAAHNCTSLKLGKHGSSQRGLAIFCV